MLVLGTMAGPAAAATQAPSVVAVQQVVAPPVPVIGTGAVAPTATPAPVADADRDARDAYTGRLSDTDTDTGSDTPATRGHRRSHHYARCRDRTIDRWPVDPECSVYPG